MSRSSLDPGKLLDSVLKLIRQDVKVIQQAIKDNPSERLSDKTAATLCRYATTIADIREEKAKLTAEQRRRLERKSTEELIEEYKAQQRAQREVKNGQPSK